MVEGWMSGVKLRKKNESVKFLMILVTSKLYSQLFSERFFFQ